jgi:lysophospholipase L1-like esterase
MKGHAMADRTATALAMAAALAALCALGPAASAGEQAPRPPAVHALPLPPERVIDTMDDPDAWRVSGGRKPGVVTRAPCEGATPGSGAVKISVKKDAIFGIALRVFRPTVTWNSFAGLSFRLKGDGSDNWGCIRVQAGSFGRAWVGNFPLKDTRWHEVRLAWGDLVPVSHTLPALGGADGHKPRDLNLIAFGKSWNFNTRHEKPAIHFCVDDLKLIKDVTGGRPRVAVGKLPPLSAAIRKLKTGKPVTILALGDSITWGTNVGGNRNAYPALLGKMLSTHYGNAHVRVINRAIGGSSTAKGRQWLHRDVRGARADVVTVLFGYNEKARGNRDQATHTFTLNLLRYVEEVAAVVERPPACILIATLPGRKANWEALDGYAKGIRALGRRHPNLTVADANGHFKKMGQPAYSKLMSDEAHPNRAGQRALAKVLFDTITAPAPAE